MDEELLRANWSEIKGRIRRRWDKFSDEELVRALGEPNCLNKMLQERYGYTSEEARRVLEHLISRVLLDKGGRAV